MINKLLIATEKDKKEFFERERRVLAEKERQSRIFNPKFRRIGVDINGLDYQIKEQNFKKDKEKKLKDALDDQIRRDNELAAILAAKERQDKRKFDDEINQFRLMHQRRQDAREYDLNDPEILKKQGLPNYTSLEETGLPCGQVFAGEDNRRKEREKVMAEQKSAWLEQQIIEKNAFNAELKAADYCYKEREKARDERALQLEVIERNCRRQLELAVLKYNSVLAEQRSCQNVDDSQIEHLDNKAEIYNSLTSDMMIENRDSSRSAFGPHRIIPYMYKGMTPEEIQVIKNAQKNQIEENKLRRDAERKMDADWQKLSSNLNYTTALLEKEKANKRRMEAVNVKRQNLLLSQEQKEKQKYFDKIVYTNEPSEEFFNKFNTTSR